MLNRVRAALTGQYLIEAERGRGATSVVFAARDLKHGRRVALKVLSPEVTAALGPTRFLKEIRTTAGLHHPHILPLLDSGQADGLIYYTMPFVDGESLRQRIDRDGRLPLRVVCALATEVGDALAYAHGAGIVHRDIKPENILIDAGGRFWVADFGLARALSEVTDQRLTHAGYVLGSPQYMSPEQFSGSGSDGRSDIYSLGCVVYEALSGKPLFSAGSVSAMLARHAHSAPPSVRETVPDVPAEVDAAVQRAVAKDPAHRYQDARDFAAALSPSASSGRPERLIEPPKPARRRAHRQFAALVIVAIMAVIAAVLMQLGRATTSNPAVIALFPLRATGAVAPDWTEGLPDLLAGVIDGTAGLVVVDPWTLWKPLRAEHDALALSPDPERAAELALRSGAGRFALGSIIDVGDSVNVQLRVYDTQTARPLHTLAMGGIEGDLRAIVRGLALQFITRAAADMGEPALGALDDGLTTSPEALKQFMRARIAMRRGMVDSAESAIHAAVEHDSTFVPALVFSAVVMSYAQFTRGQMFTGLREVVDRALALDTLVRGRERLRLHALDASIRTDGRAAADALHALLAQDSTDLHALLSLQYVTTVYGWQYGAEEAEGDRVSDRLLSLDSSYIPVVSARAWRAVAYNNDSEYERLVRLLSTDSSSVLSRMYLSCIRGVAASDSGFAPFAHAVSSDRFAGVGMLRCLRHARPDRAEQFTEILRASDDPYFSVLGTVEHARMDVARGRTATALRKIDSGEIPAAHVTQLRTIITSASIAGVADPVTGAAAAAALSVHVPVDSAEHYFETRPVWWAGWNIAAHHAQFGDTLVARRWQQVFRTFPVGGSPRHWAAALVADLDARLAVRRGDTESALMHALRAYELWDVHTENTFESMPEPQMRLHLAMLHRAAGQTDSARSLLRSLVPPATWLGFLTARAAFELAVIEEERGDLRAAARHYTTAARLWEGGDAEIESWWIQANRGVQRTRTEQM